MGRPHSFMDKEFNRNHYDPDDRIDFTPGQVFVVMPFGKPQMDKVYSVIKNECAKLNLSIKRVDENVGSGFILREITKLIEDAEFIIVDLTHERPNVYYELGYAHGVGNEDLDILLIAKKGTRIHFDISPLRIMFYESMTHLHSIIKSSMSEMIRKTRNK
jgi:hypothetical protein